MALVEYEVLFTLFRADGRLRMSQLAERASLSRSGLSRVVDVLEHQRLVRRRPDADDGRAVVATLTPRGRQRLERCRLRLLDQRFADRPISTLAFDAGFGDLSGFNRAFKAKYGLSPRQLRSAAGPPGASRS
jgi:DNA-binding MarR family transcriptional regulator